MNKYTLFIFRRDLRLADNPALELANGLELPVIPAFFIDQNQLKAHPYRSEPGLGFLKESLEELNQELIKHNSKLYFFKTGTIEWLERLKNSSIKITNIVLNLDVTPFAKNRDDQIKQYCEANNINFYSSWSNFLTKPGDILTLQNKIPQVYSQFCKKLLQIPITNPNYPTPKQLITATSKLPDEVSQGWNTFQTDFVYETRGGRKNALDLLKKIKDLANYDQLRNFPALNHTSQLSPHLKFGTISPREVYAVSNKYFGHGSQFSKEIVWRDFFSQIAFFYPHVFEGAFLRQYGQIQWSDHQEHFERWCQGETGFPIVDAGMRQLKKSGWMHNRVRMITASFLVKNLQISWRKGEAWFAKNLVDYDPAVNNGNWQWAASTGCDAQPYFRIFNPWLQQVKFDPDCHYIYHWIPELKGITPKDLGNIPEKSLKLSSYPDPIVDHGESSRKTKELFKSVRDS